MPLCQELEWYPGKVMHSLFSLQPYYPPSEATVGIKIDQENSLFIAFLFCVLAIIFFFCDKRKSRREKRVL